MEHLLCAAFGSEGASGGGDSGHGRAVHGEDGGLLLYERREDYQRGYERGKQDSSFFRFVLTIRSDDISKMIDDPDHSARMIGTVEAPAPSEKPLMASEGEFQLVRLSEEHVATKQMVYRMKLTGAPRPGHLAAPRGPRPGVRPAGSTCGLSPRPRKKVSVSSLA